ncbi:hypothetical protein [Anaerosacchariphilus polymeriproducens]|uniref:Uncharacterized protein n=1 Tax=Anaerosacchariphilus polymeriproducens TaxID=1812858 RepID=A0A371ARQ9_9FIRM|nr:hypothetical protein [Anaerosacchariphilus polymeriproducens]RDU22253.1 hypothetical protein DWV06_17180 [Anaerosacchariphilus polymeriproducens]
MSDFKIIEQGAAKLLLNSWIQQVGKIQTDYKDDFADMDFENTEFDDELEQVKNAIDSHCNQLISDMNESGI